jgi:hypothetical protein
MTIKQLIKILKTHAKTHGDNCQIAIPRLGPTFYNRFGEDLYIEESSISTILTSRGPEIEW